MRIFDAQVENISYTRNNKGNVNDNLGKKYKIKIVKLNIFSKRNISKYWKNTNNVMRMKSRRERRSIYIGGEKQKINMSIKSYKLREKMIESSRNA